jgi:hypothetical protein
VNVSVAVVAIVDGFILSGRSVGILCEHSNQPQLNLNAPLPDIICFSSTIRIDCVLTIRTEINNQTSFIHSFIYSVFQRSNKVDVEHVIEITIGTVKQVMTIKYK